MGASGYSREYYERAEERLNRRPRQENPTSPSSGSKTPEPTKPETQPNSGKSQRPDRYHRPWVI